MYKAEDYELVFNPNRDCVGCSFNLGDDGCILDAYALDREFPECNELIEFDDFSSLTPDTFMYGVFIFKPKDYSNV